MRGRSLIIPMFFWFFSTAALAQPLLRYTFDESAGNAIDSGTGAPAHATLNGGAIRSSNTPSGTGASIDLRDGDLTYAYALAGDAQKLDGLNALTLTTWLNLESYTGGNNRLIAKQSSANFGGFSWNMNPEPNTGNVGPDNFRLGLFLGDSFGGFTSDFSTEDVNAFARWVFLAVTYDRTQPLNNTRFYIGGVNDSIAQLGGARTLQQLTIDGDVARVGIGFTDASPTSDFSAIGFQDDVRVYSRVLSSAELEQVRQEGVVPEPACIMLVLSAAAFSSIVGRKR